MRGKHTAVVPAAAETTDAIEVHGVSKRFGRHEALRDVDFTVPRGAVYGLIGPNGAGKTTTMRILLDVVRPTSGRVTVAGHDSRTGGPDLRRRIGYLPGELTLQGRITGRALLEQYASISGPVPAGRADALAERLRLDLRRPVRALSKGNKQKLGIIQAFMHEPEVLVLDEPTSGLDPLVQQEFLTMVREARGSGRTVLLSSHVISEIQEAADAVVILRDGRLVEVAGVEALRRSAVRRVRLTVDDDDEPALRRVLARAGLTRMTIGQHDAGAGPDGTATARGLDVTAELGGTVAGLLAALAALPVTDLVLEEPDLQDAVLRLYGTAPGRGDGDAGGGSAAASRSSAHDRPEQPRIDQPMEAGR